MAALVALALPVAAQEQRPAGPAPGTDTVIITSMPHHRAKVRETLSRLLGKAHGPATAGSESEVWSVPRHHTGRLAKRLERLGVKVTRLREDWNHLLKRHRGEVSPAQNQMLERLRKSPHTMGIGLLKAPEAPLTGYALTGPGSKPQPPGSPPQDKVPSTIVLPINETHNVTLERVRVSSGPEGCVWSGVVQETGERALLMWWKDGRLTGLVGYKGRIYTVMNIGGDVHAMIENDPGKMPADHAVGAATRPAHSSAGDSITPRPPAAATPPPPAPAIPEIAPFPDAERQALEAKSVTIDVMMLYTKAALGHYIGGPADLIALAIENANETFRNSGMGNIRLRLVHTQAVDYEEAGGAHFEHLYRMVDGDGPFKDVRRLRNEKRADIVGLIMHDPSGCGLSTRVAPDAEDAFFVVHHSCAAITITIAHEIGHILGARHDRGIDASNAPFAYGHGFVNGTKWRTMMSYQESCQGCARIPFWSNPRVTYKGEPTGTLAEDNARVLLQQAERVSNFR